MHRKNSTDNPSKYLAMKYTCRCIKDGIDLCKCRNQDCKKFLPEDILKNLRKPGDVDKSTVDRPVQRSSAVIQEESKTADKKRKLSFKDDQLDTPQKKEVLEKQAEDIKAPKEEEKRLETEIRSARLDSQIDTTKLSSVIIKGPSKSKDLEQITEPFKSKSKESTDVFKSSSSRLLKSKVSEIQPSKPKELVEVPKYIDEVLKAPTPELIEPEVVKASPWRSRDLPSTGSVKSQSKSKVSSLEMGPFKSEDVKPTEPEPKNVQSLISKELELEISQEEKSVRSKEGFRRNSLRSKSREISSKTDSLSRASGSKEIQFVILGTKSPSIKTELSKHSAVRPALIDRLPSKEIEKPASRESKTESLRSKIPSKKSISKYSQKDLDEKKFVDREPSKQLEAAKSKTKETTSKPESLEQMTHSTKSEISKRSERTSKERHLGKESSKEIEVSESKAQETPSKTESLRPATSTTKSRISAERAESSKEELSTGLSPSVKSPISHHSGALSEKPIFPEKEPSTEINISKSKETVGSKTLSIKPEISRISEGISEKSVSTEHKPSKEHHKLNAEFNEKSSKTTSIVGSTKSKSSSQKVESKTTSRLESLSSEQKKYTSKKECVKDINEEKQQELKPPSVAKTVESKTSKSKEKILKSTSKSLQEIESSKSKEMELKILESEAVKEEETKEEKQLEESTEIQEIVGDRETFKIQPVSSTEYLKSQIEDVQIKENVSSLVREKSKDEQLVESLKSKSQQIQAISDSIKTRSDDFESIAVALRVTSDDIGTIADAVKEKSDFLETLTENLKSKSKVLDITLGTLQEPEEAQRKFSIASDVLKNKSEIVGTISEAIKSKSEDMQSIKDALDSRTTVVEDISDTVKSTLEDLQSISSTLKVKSLILDTLVALDAGKIGSESVRFTADEIKTPSEEYQDYQDAVEQLQARSDLLSDITEALKSTTNDIRTISNALKSSTEDFLAISDAIGSEKDVIQRIPSSIISIPKDMKPSSAQLAEIPSELHSLSDHMEQKSSKLASIVDALESKYKDMEIIADAFKSKSWKTVDYTPLESKIKDLDQKILLKELILPEKKRRKCRCVKKEEKRRRSRSKDRESSKLPQEEEPLEPKRWATTLSEETPPKQKEMAQALEDEPLKSVSIQEVMVSIPPLEKTSTELLEKGIIETLEEELPEPRILPGFIPFEKKSTQEVVPQIEEISTENKKAEMDGSILPSILTEEISKEASIKTEKEETESSSDDKIDEASSAQDKEQLLASSSILPQIFSQETRSTQEVMSDIPQSSLKKSMNEASDEELPESRILPGFIPSERKSTQEEMLKTAEKSTENKMDDMDGSIIPSILTEKLSKEVSMITEKEATELPPDGKQVEASSVLDKEEPLESSSILPQRFSQETNSMQEVILDIPQSPLKKSVAEVSAEELPEPRILPGFIPSEKKSTPAEISKVAETSTENKMAEMDGSIIPSILTETLSKEEKMSMITEKDVTKSSLDDKPVELSAIQDKEEPLKSNSILPQEFLQEPKSMQEIISDGPQLPLERSMADASKEELPEPRILSVSNPYTDNNEDLKNSTESMQHPRSKSLESSPKSDLYTIARVLQSRSERLQNVSDSIKLKSLGIGSILDAIRSTTAGINTVNEVFKSSLALAGEDVDSVSSDLKSKSERLQVISEALKSKLGNLGEDSVALQATTEGLDCISAELKARSNLLKSKSNIIQSLRGSTSRSQDLSSWADSFRYKSENLEHVAKDLKSKSENIIAVISALKSTTSDLENISEIFIEKSKDLSSKLKVLKSKSEDFESDPSYLKQRSEILTSSSENLQPITEALSQKSENLEYIRDALIAKSLEICNIAQYLQETATGIVQYADHMKSDTSIIEVAQPRTSKVSCNKASEHEELRMQSEELKASFRELGSVLENLKSKSEIMEPVSGVLKTISYNLDSICESLKSRSDAINNFSDNLKTRSQAVGDISDSLRSKFEGFENVTKALDSTYESFEEVSEALSDLMECPGTEECPEGTSFTDKTDSNLISIYNRIASDAAVLKPVSSALKEQTEQLEIIADGLTSQFENLVTEEKNLDYISDIIKEKSEIIQKLTERICSVSKDIETLSEELLSQNIQKEVSVKSLPKVSNEKEQEDTSAINEVVSTQDAETEGEIKDGNQSVVEHDIPAKPDGIKSENELIIQASEEEKIESALDENEIDIREESDKEPHEESDTINDQMYNTEANEEPQLELVEDENEDAKSNIPADDLKITQSLEINPVEEDKEDTSDFVETHSSKIGKQPPNSNEKQLCKGECDKYKLKKSATDLGNKSFSKTPLQSKLEVLQSKIEALKSKSMTLNVPIKLKYSPNISEAKRTKLYSLRSELEEMDPDSLSFASNLNQLELQLNALRTPSLTTLVGSIQSKLDRLRRMEHLRRSEDPILKLEVASIESKIQNMEAKLDDAKGLSENLDPKSEQMKSQLENIENKLDNLKAISEPYDPKTINIEKELQQLTSQLSNLIAESEGVDPRVADLKAELQDLDARLNSIKSSSQNFNSKSENLMSKLLDLESRIDSLISESEGFDPKFSNLKSEVNELEKKIEYLQAHPEILDECPVTTAKENDTELKLQPGIMDKDELSCVYCKYCKRRLTLEGLRLEIEALKEQSNKMTRDEIINKPETDKPIKNEETPANSKNSENSSEPSESESIEKTSGKISEINGISQPSQSIILSEIPHIPSNEAKSDAKIFEANDLPKSSKVSSKLSTILQPKNTGSRITNRSNETKSFCDNSKCSEGFYSDGSSLGSSLKTAKEEFIENPIAFPEPDLPGLPEDLPSSKATLTSVHSSFKSKPESINSKQEILKDSSKVSVHLKESNIHSKSLISQAGSIQKKIDGIKTKIDTFVSEYSHSSNLSLISHISSVKGELDEIKSEISRLEERANAESKFSFTKKLSFLRSEISNLKTDVGALGPKHKSDEVIPEVLGKKLEDIPNVTEEDLWFLANDKEESQSKSKDNVQEVKSKESEIVQEQKLEDTKIRSSKEDIDDVSKQVSSHITESVIDDIEPVPVSSRSVPEQRDEPRRELTPEEQCKPHGKICKGPCILESASSLEKQKSEISNRRSLGSRVSFKFSRKSSSRSSTKKE